MLLYDSSQQAQPHSFNYDTFHVKWLLFWIPRLNGGCTSIQTGRTGEDVLQCDVQEVAWRHKFTSRTSLPSMPRRFTAQNVCVSCYSKWDGPTTTRRGVLFSARQQHHGYLCHSHRPTFLRQRAPVFRCRRRMVVIKLQHIQSPTAWWKVLWKQ